MTNQEWIDLFRSIPEPEHGKTVLVLSNNSELCVDTLIRFDSNFLVLRGRVGGTIEESRGFVVPFHQIVYVRLERNVKIQEMEGMFGVANFAISEAKAGDALPAAPSTAAPPTDPAAASRMLLDKLRANRTAAQQVRQSIPQTG